MKVYSSEWRLALSSTWRLFWDLDKAWHVNWQKDTWWILHLSIELAFPFSRKRYDQGKNSETWWLSSKKYRSFCTFWQEHALPSPMPLVVASSQYLLVWFLKNNYRRRKKSYDIIDKAWSNRTLSVSAWSFVSILLLSSWSPLRLVIH